ncbi:MAG TPA: DNA recombination protein RmuC [Chlamydiales bacterium]|nr:DNA recombination protein RmuC [Chlamydiales bacterium]
MISILILIACTLLLCLLFHKKASDTQKSLENTFKSLTFEIFEKNSRFFQESAESRQKAVDETLKPFQESLKSLDLQQRELEKQRIGAYAALTKQVEGMVNAEIELRKETAQLVNALRTPQIRGSWGEIHLRRVVEIAGLLNHCDFYEQKSFESDGKIWRPDLIIRLPTQRYIAVDAKTPLHAYLDASDAGDDNLRKKKLLDHAQSIRKHIKELSAKEYWKQLDLAPEYVILFLPAEAFYSAALQSDPTLIELGADQNIIVATPTTLIAILRAIAFTWKQDGLSKNAKEIARLGQELYERLGTVCEHWNKVGKNLNTAVDAFNQSISSMESRVMVTARKLKETGSIQAEISEPIAIEKLAKVLEDR